MLGAAPPPSYVVNPSLSGAADSSPEDNTKTMTGGPPPMQPSDSMSEPQVCAREQGPRSCGVLMMYPGRDPVSLGNTCKHTQHTVYAGSEDRGRPDRQGRSRAGFDRFSEEGRGSRRRRAWVRTGCASAYARHSSLPFCALERLPCSRTSNRINCHRHFYGQYKEVLCTRGPGW